VFNHMRHRFICLESYEYVKLGTRVVNHMRHIFICLEPYEYVKCQMLQDVEALNKYVNEKKLYELNAMK
jgi:hypothetical protein